jgi:hypothetical protein
MGFLDFLKKDKPQPAPLFTQENVMAPPAPDAIPPPRFGIPGLPSDPSQIDWTSPPELAPKPLSSNPVPTATMLSGQMQNPAPMDLHDDGDLDKIPTPPVNKEAPDFLQAAANDFEPVKATPSAPAPAPAPSAAVPPITLPDFTDEDLALLDKAAGPMPALPPLPPLPATVKIVSDEQLVPPPANAVAIPEEDIKLPTGEIIAPEQIEAAKFLSSSSYFTIIADIKATRKSLRTSDDTIKDAILRHEQLDQQYKRVAADMNAVQEHFIKIDGALFE